MKSLLSTAFVGVFLFSVQAIELPYKHLKKSYDNEYDKTLERAQRWMKLLPKNPAGYYYASIIHFEQAQKQSTTRKRYLQLVKSLKYARELELTKNREFLDRIEWDTLTPYIHSFTVNVKAELEEQELDRLAMLIEKRSKKFDWMKKKRTYDHYGEGRKTSVKVPGKTPVLAATGTFKNGEYFGAPLGTELIASHSRTSEREMLELINAERRKQGMQELVFDENLARAARYHAFDMGSQGYFTHKSQDRNNDKLKEVAGTFTRIRAFYSDSFVNSENIAGGNESAEQTYMQWYNSKGHYDNMFNASSAKVGIGVCYIPESEYGYYWVMCTAL